MSASGFIFIQNACPLNINYYEISPAEPQLFSFLTGFIRETCSVLISISVQNPGRIRRESAFNIPGFPYFIFRVFSGNYTIPDFRYSPCSN